MDEALRYLARECDPATREAWVQAPLPDSDPLRAVAALRAEHPEWPPELASAIATQRDLRQRALSRSSIPAGPWLMTRTGLEQSTRADVARRRAARLAAARVASVVDLTAGLGVDSWACAEQGMTVLAIEQDPLTADLCAANVPTAHVLCADSTQLVGPNRAELAELAGSGELPEPVCFLVDPGRRGPAQRRDGTRAAPERDPQRWQPPWSFVDLLRARGGYVAVKAPGKFDPPDDWQAEWVGIGDYVAECALYAGPAPMLEHHRQATLLSPVDASFAITLPADDEVGSIGPLSDFIGEVHPVFHRSMAALCSAGASRLSPSSHYLTAPHPTGAGVRWFAVKDIAPVKQIRDRALALGIDAVAIKSRESKVPLDRLRSLIGLPDGNRYAVIIARGFDDAILAEVTAESTDELASEPSGQAR